MFDTGIPAADNAKIITVLREPVSRTKSFIRFVASPSARHTLRDPSKPFSVDEFLESGCPELSNLQVKFLAVRHDIDWESGLSELGAVAAVSLAKERLFQQVHAFGVQEYFDESWVVLWQSIGIAPPVYATMKRTKGHLSFTPEQERKIRELNLLDIELYAEAKREFELRLQNGAIPPNQLEAFQRRQRRYGPWITMIRSKASHVYWSYRKARRILLSRMPSKS